jgi:hypothetical protein
MAREVAIREHRPPVRRRRLRTVLAALTGLLGLVPLIAVGLPLVGISRVRYVVDGERLEIQTRDLLNRGRSVALDRVTEIETVQLPRGRRTLGTGLPGYCVGRFSYEGLGQVWQATDCSAGAVLLRVRDEARPVVVTPADVPAFVQALRTRSRIEARPAVSPSSTAGAAWLAIGAFVVGAGVVATALATFVAGPERMRYRVARGELEVQTLFGRRRWSLDAVNARPHRVRLGLRLWGVGLPGYYTGSYLADGKSTRVYATQTEGVLLEGATRIFVSPEDPEPFLAALAREGAIVRR